MSETQNKSSDTLFEELSRKKKQRKNKIIRTVAIAIAVVAVILIAGVSIMTKRVQAQFGSARDEVLSFSAERGTISTKVSGSGTLAQVDQEELVLPSGVEITQVMVDTGDIVSKGDLLATVDMSTVMTALADIQEQLDDLDDDINAASGDKASSYITAGVAGRVKIIYGEAEMDVSGCMADHGALAILSLGGNMAVDIETDKLSKGETVDVAAKVFSVGETIVAYADTATVYQVSTTENGWALDQELRTDLMITQISILSTTPCSSGDIILIMTGTNADGDVVIENKVVVYPKAQSESGDTDGMTEDMSGMMGGMTGMGSISGFGGLSGGYGGATTSQQYELFDLDGDMIVTVTSQDSMTLSIEIDEQDIANVFPGQTAEVKINALKNETFKAVVTKVGVIGINNGGSSKFTVELTLDQGESMLDGMSATATIPLHTVEDVPVIPVEALVEKGAQTFVYTALDKETGDPTAPVAVEVGISDTEFAQILSGLDVGTTYYYTYYDTLALPS